MLLCYIPKKKHEFSHKLIIINQFWIGHLDKPRCAREVFRSGQSQTGRHDTFDGWVLIPQGWDVDKKNEQPPHKMEV